MRARAQTEPTTVDLLVTLVERQFRLRSKRALLGRVWPILAPFVLAALYYFVFQRVFRAPIGNYSEFLLCGLLPWAFLAMTVGSAITSISFEPELVRKMGRRLELLPISVTLERTVNLIITVVLLVAYLAVAGHLRPAVLPLVVLPLAATVLLVVSLSLAVALIDVYNHDLQQVLGNILTVWFFLVPIVYQPDMAPSTVTFLRSVDPMSLIVGQMRSILYYGRIDEPLKMVAMVALTAALFVVSLTLFRRLGADLPKDV